MSNLPELLNGPDIDQQLLHALAGQYTHAQQLWLSGYLYGLAQREGLSAATPKTTFAAIPAATQAATAITVLYGSHTGNSKKVAQRLLERLRQSGREATLADMNEYPSKNLKQEKILLLIVSTHGEGDPPVAAEEFYKWLHGPRAPQLPELQFSVCALGDKSYLQFCQTGQDFDARLEALGAKRLSARVDCDVDYEAVAEEWINAVLAQLPQSVPAAANAAVLSKAASKGVATESQFNRKNPFEAPLLEKIQLNGKGSAKETWHLELSLEGSGLHYEPGDSLGVYARNPESLVKEILYAAMLNGNKLVAFEGVEKPFRQILLESVELTVLNRELLEKYAAWTGSAPLKNILQDPEALRAFVWGRNVADLLREYPAAMSEATLLSFLRKMPPRLYSIASSLSAHAEEVHLTVGAVRYQYNGRPHQGVASTFLADQLAIGEGLPVFVERNEYFKLPADEADILMIGPGTGVAPFRAFVEERAERGAQGRNWLFFGNPHFESDFLYQTEWLQHLKKGTLDRLDVAFSRDQAQKIYVQHRLLERSRQLYERLENGAYVYVCGDKNHMAHDVQQAFAQLVARESGKGEAYGEEYLKNLKKQRRYLEDVY